MIEQTFPVENFIQEIEDCFIKEATQLMWGKPSKDRHPVTLEPLDDE